MSILLVIIFVLLAAAGYFFNTLVVLATRVKSAWADIDVQLKRRHDLVPNLVEIVKSYAVHEKSTLEAVVAARSRSINARGGELDLAEKDLGANLRSLIALVENYPNLKADGTFLQLHTQLVEVEDTLQYARRFYNGSVRDYNTAIESFPGNIFALVFHFKAREFFQLDNAQDSDAPQAKIKT